jgi:hypothetical protein
MLRRVGRRVVVGVVGLACLFLGGCGGSAAVETAVVSGASTNTFTTGRVPDLTLVAMDGSRLVVVATLDARCHPQGWEPQAAAVGATPSQEE